MQPVELSCDDILEYVTTEYDRATQEYQAILLVTPINLKAIGQAEGKVVALREVIRVIHTGRKPEVPNG